MTTVQYLADKSALARLGRQSVHARLAPLLQSGAVATCGIVDLELLYSATGWTTYTKLRAERRAFPRARVGEEGIDRAIEVQSTLARSGHHRAVRIPGLLFAAAAESAGLTILHYDADFDTIASVTGQPTEWVVPRGSAD